MDKPLNKEKHNILTFEDKVIGGGLYFLALIFLIINSFVFFGTDSSTQFLSNKVDTASEKISKVSFSDAKAFMKNRCININQRYLQAKHASLPEGDLYMFLTQSIEHPHIYCISAINTHVLNVGAVDCAGVEKIEQFNAIF